MNNFKKIFSISVTLAILISFSIYFSKSKENPYLEINNTKINLIVSDTEGLRTKGLSDTKELKDNEAMLFVFAVPSKYGFWMKDMNYPIDIIWLDEDKKVVHIEKNASPESYPKVFFPPENSLYVLEFNGGFSTRNSITVGNFLDFNYR